MHIKSILMIITSFPPAYSGAAQALIKLGKGLVQDGLHVSVLCALPAGARDHELLDGIEVFRIYSGRYVNLTDVPTFKNQFIFALSSSFFILKHRNMFDVIHFHGVGRSSLLSLLVAKFVGIPVLGKITHIDHDSPSAHLKRRFGKLLLSLLGLIDAFIAVSPRIEADIKHLDCWRNSKIFQIPNPLDSTLYSPLEQNSRTQLRSKLGIDSGEFVFLFVGAVCKGKGIDVLVNVWKLLREELGTSIKLIVSGPPFELAMVELLQGQNDIEYIGTKKLEEVREYYLVADAFVLPTRGEGLPNVLIEAMSCSLPCIAGRLDGITDYLLGNDRGILVDPDNLTEVTKAMLKVYEQPQLAREMGIRARQWVIENADIKSVSSQYLDIYSSLLDQK